MCRVAHGFLDVGTVRFLHTQHVGTRVCLRLVDIVGWEGIRLYGVAPCLAVLVEAVLGVNGRAVFVGDAPGAVPGVLLDLDRIELHRGSSDYVAVVLGEPVIREHEHTQVVVLRRSLAPGAREHVHERCDVAGVVRREGDRLRAWGDLPSIFHCGGCILLLCFLPLREEDVPHVDERDARGHGDQRHGA